MFFVAALDGPDFPRPSAIEWTVDMVKIMI